MPGGSSSSAAPPSCTSPRTRRSSPTSSASPTSWRASSRDARTATCWSTCTAGGWSSPLGATAPTGRACSWASGRRRSGWSRTRGTWSRGRTGWRAASSSTPASAGSRPSTWCGCPGARSSPSSPRTWRSVESCRSARRWFWPGTRRTRSRWRVTRRPAPSSRTPSRAPAEGAAMAIVSATHAPGVGGPPPPPPDLPPSRRGRRTPYLLLLPGALWLLAFFAVPLATLAGTSTQTPAPSGETGAFQQTFRLANYVDALTAYAPQFGRSFLYALIATLLALAIGYPLAYAIAFKAGRWRNVLLVLVVAPFFCSFILRTIAWRQILADEGFVVRTLKSLHLMGETTTLTASAVAVVAGITYNFLPFMTLPLYASLERIDGRLLEAGGDLYASGATVFRKVTLPLSMPGVVAGTLLTFIPAAGDYVNAALLGNSRTTMIGNVVQSRFFTIVDSPTAAALSFLLMAAIVLLVTLYVRRAGTEELV